MGADNVNSPLVFGFAVGTEKINPSLVVDLPAMSAVKANPPPVIVFSVAGTVELLFSDLPLTFAVTTGALEVRSLIGVAFGITGAENENPPAFGWDEVVLVKFDV